MNTDTPRTDSNEKYFVSSISGLPDPSRNYVPIDFARIIERELNEARHELNGRCNEIGALMSHNASLCELNDQLKVDYDALHKCLLNREESLRRSGDDWVKAKTEHDQWREVADELNFALANDGIRANNPLSFHARCDALAAYEKLKDK